MSTLAVKTDERVEAVYFSRDSIVVNLMDGRTIFAPLTWYPKLLKASYEQKAHWETCGGGYGNSSQKKFVKKTATQKNTSRKRSK